MQRIFFSVLVFAAVSASSCSNNSAAGGSTAAAEASAGGSGSDVYYEYTTHSTGAHITIDGSSRLWISAAGKLRRETQMTNPMRPDKSGPIVMIGSSDKPFEDIIIDDSAKTWSTNHIDTAAMNMAGMKMESSASKVGDEKILGFNCAHARVISHKSMGGFMNETDTLDLWKSAEVPVPAIFNNMMNRFESGMGLLYSKDIPAQLKQMGCDRFLVKMEMHGKEVSSTTELTKVEKKDLPGSLFEKPAGYKEDKNGGF